MRVSAARFEKSQLVQQRGDGEVEDRVAQEFQPFVVIAAGAAVSQRACQQGLQRMVAAGWVKRFKFQSPTLTKFWGRPVYLGAVAMLPRGYERETMAYPVNYVQGHFSIAPPYGFDEKNDFSKIVLDVLDPEQEQNENGDRRRERGAARRASRR